MPNLRHSGHSEFLDGLALGFYTTCGLFLGILVYLYCYHKQWFEYHVLWKQRKPSSMNAHATVQHTNKYYV
jgi:hypothetical protein